MYPMDHASPTGGIVVVFDATLLHCTALVSTAQKLIKATVADFFSRHAKVSRINDLTKLDKLLKEKIH